MGIVYKKSFTLIETIVVIAVIGLILPVIFSIFFVLLQQQTKIYRLNTVKKEGDFVISLMESTIKNRAVNIYNSAVLNDANIVCKGETPGDSYDNPYFLDDNNKFFSYKLNGTKIASDSANSVDLTSIYTKVSGFSISCTRNRIYSTPSVLVSFTIQYNTTSTRPEDTASLFYQTKIKLRNY